MAAINRRSLLKKALLHYLLRRRLQRRRMKYRKSFWVRKIYQERLQKGEFHLLVQDMKLFDHRYFFQYFRMTPSVFEKLLHLVGPFLTRKSTNMRDPIGPSERLSLTLKYLASGDSQCSISSSYRISPSVVSRTIRETCHVIWECLSHRGFIKAPSSPEEWRLIAKFFEDKWNFPHALGALDGKHVIMQCPARGGSDYFNYKKTHSIVLLAVCDGQYKFLLVDIGDAGRQSDGSVYSNSDLGYAIDNGILNFPSPSKVGNSNEVFPYVFLADDAFGLKTYLMKPYPGSNLQENEKIFNYRFSRGRRVIENTFGIAASRFRVFRKPIIAQVDTVKQITKAVVVLHNFLMCHRLDNEPYSYCPPNYVDQEGPAGISAGAWRENTTENGAMQPINNIGSNNYSKSAKETRKMFMEYFNSNEGAVAWQLDMIRRTSNSYDTL